MVCDNANAHQFYRLVLICNEFVNLCKIYTIFKYNSTREKYLGYIFVYSNQKNDKQSFSHFLKLIT